MKKLLLIIILVTGLIACDKNEASIKPTTPTTSLVMTQGKWKATNMNHNGNTEAHFTNYEFTFNPNGVLTVVKEGVTTNGYWSTRTENSEQKLNITFSSPLDLYVIFLGQT